MNSFYFVALSLVFHCEGGAVEGMVDPVTKVIGEATMTNDNTIVHEIVVMYRTPECL